MTLNELSKAKQMPNWVGALVTIGALVSGAGAMWTQIEERFPDLFDEGDTYYEEYARHFAEEPVEQTFRDEAIGTIGVAWYPSDGCLLITVPGREPHWLTRSSLPPIDGVGRIERRLLLAGVALLDEPVCVTEGCHNPHPGKFETRNGEPRVRDGAIWTPVYRLFEDGCEHYQLRRSDGAWDVDEDGAPRVCWISCIHEPRR
ncbi:MAG TPA: hypothetical protein ENH89_17230 [Aurantimonas coralicida]|uniref:Uncharacterized protein n=1 Tax=Aurantimonas coralicida TaxID=182270 RepID=A0A9C9NII8_9HYPH|nr:hypothetical protein [Aurantimonas coralicida]